MKIPIDNHRFVACVVAFACFCSATNAEVKPSRLFSDHMVFQRDMPVNVWGTADPGERVTVAIGSDQASTTAGTKGGWVVTLPQRPASSEAVEIKITGKNDVVIRDVLFGDVWLASGQSNMEMAFFWTAQGKEVAKTINTPLIRIFKVATAPKDAPQDFLDRGGWTVCTTNSALNLGQLGYYYALELHKKLGVPIGVINSSVSGTRLEAWMSAESLAADPGGQEVLGQWQKALDDFPAKKAKYEADLSVWKEEKAAAVEKGEAFARHPPKAPYWPGGNNAPAHLFNAMIYPLARFAFRGVIWYQGESNSKNSVRYRTLFPLMIQDWRSVFGRDMPFYWVQLPNYNIGTEYGDDWAGVREAQAMALSLPDTGMAVTVDIGDGGNVHPNNKAEVARRLALVALSGTYGDKAVVAAGPVFDRAEFNGVESVRIHFKNVANGLKSSRENPEGKIAGFTMAGEDRRFHSAAARIDGATGTLLVSCQNVATPVAVRYAWSNNPSGLSLVNSAGLPLAPFRTDEW